jgi:lipid-binding SYLF domain-containing protein
MTQKGMDSLLSSTFKMGADASVARDRSAPAPKSDVRRGLITFSRSKGLYGGLNLDGTVVSVNDDWNKAYYGKPVLPPDILIKGTASNKGAAKLLSDVSKAAK